MFQDIYKFPLHFQVRGLLAQLGYEKLDDIIGRTELLKARNLPLEKTSLLDLGYLLPVSLTLSFCGVSDTVFCQSELQIGEDVKYRDKTTEGAYERACARRRCAGGPRGIIARLLQFRRLSRTCFNADIGGDFR